MSVNQPAPGAVAPRENFLVGAAVGSGLVARAAEGAGTDFVVALNAGRHRLRGLPSVASMLPLGDANADVLAVAPGEIAAQLRVPVYAGLSVFAGPEAVARDLDLLAASRVRGVVNFPTVVHYPPDVQAALEAAGIGFSAELAMLARAATLGLATLVYVKTEAEARAAVGIGPDMVCINFGWNAGGRLSELVADVSINEAILRARTIARRLAREAPGTAVLIEGGPVVDPGQVAEICAQAGTQGYIGGSTLDRLAIEDAVHDRALAFKSAGRSRRAARAADARLRRLAGQAGLVGGSEALQAALARLAALADGQGPVVISGPPGTQRHAAAGLVRALAGLDAAPVRLNTLEQAAFETGVRLFGRGAQRPGLLEAASGGVLQIEPLAGLAPRWQRKLARFLDRGEVTRYLGRAPVAPRPRLILIAEVPLATGAGAGAVVPELAERLAAREVVMPGLPARREDVPELLEMLRAQAGARFSFGASALGMLMRRQVAGHVTGLRRLVEALQAAGAAGELGAVDLERLGVLDPAPPAPAGDTAVAERAWILESLRRHGFNRTAAAREMGIARKTLYNRMRRHGL